MPKPLATFPQLRDRLRQIRKGIKRRDVVAGDASSNAPLWGTREQEAVTQVIRRAFALLGAMEQQGISRARTFVREIEKLLKSYLGHKLACCDVFPEMLDADAAENINWLEDVLPSIDRFVDLLVVQLDALAHEFPNARQADGKLATAATPSSGEPKTFTIHAMREMTGLANAALNKYAKLAKVPAPARGKRNHRYSTEQVRMILGTIIQHSNEEMLVVCCQDALRNLQ